VYIKRTQDNSSKLDTLVLYKESAEFIWSCRDLAGASNWDARSQRPLLYSRGSLGGCTGGRQNAPGLRSKANWNGIRVGVGLGRWFGIRRGVGLRSKANFADGRRLGPGCGPT